MIVAADVDGTPVPVLDPFCGSGSTLLAARESNHRYIGIEKDPHVFKTLRARLAREVR